MCTKGTIKTFLLLAITHLSMLSSTNAQFFEIYSELPLPLRVFYPTKFDYSQNLDEYTIGGHQSIGWFYQGAMLVNIDGNGVYNWSRLYNSTSPGAKIFFREVAYAQNSNEDVSFVLAGSESLPAATSKAILTGMSKGGSPLWARAFSEMNVSETFCDVDFDLFGPASDFVAFGHSQSRGHHFVKIDINGNVLISKYYNLEGTYFRPMQLTPLSNGGFAFVSATDQDACSVATHPDHILFGILDENLELRMSQIVSIPPHNPGDSSFVRPVDLVENETNSEIAILGQYLTTGAPASPVLFLFDFDGNWVSTSRYDIESNDVNLFGNSIGWQEVDNSFVFTAHDRETRQTVLTKVNDVGGLKWSHLYTAGRSRMIPTDLISREEKGYAITGGMTEEEFFLLETDLDGSSGSPCQEEVYLLKSDLTICADIVEMVKDEIDLSANYDMTFKKLNLTQYDCLTPMPIAEDKVELKVYPNPSNKGEKLKIDLADNRFVARLLFIEEATGVSFEWKNFSVSEENEMNIDLTGIKEGSYTLQVRYENGEIASSRLIIQE